MTVIRRFMANSRQQCFLGFNWVSSNKILHTGNIQPQWKYLCPTSLGYKTVIESFLSFILFTCYCVTHLIHLLRWIMIIFLCALKSLGLELFCKLENKCWGFVYSQHTILSDNYSCIVTRKKLTISTGISGTTVNTWNCAWTFYLTNVKVFVHT